MRTNMEVRAKKALGQHFLTDLNIAQKIVESLQTVTGTEGRVLEIGPGMGVLSRFLLDREDIDFKMVEIDEESVNYLRSHFPVACGRLLQADFLKLSFGKIFDGPFSIIGNLPYNISSPIFFRVFEERDIVPQMVCMIQKEVADRIAGKPGNKNYGILSVLLQTWFDIEYLFSVEASAFAPPPKVRSAVIRLRRNSRTSLPCSETLFKSVVKTSFGQRRKTLRNSLRPLVAKKAQKEGWDAEALQKFTSAPVWNLRPEDLGAEEFINLTLSLE